MASPLTLRLDPALRRRVATIAKRKPITASGALREAITAWVNTEENAVSTYDSVKDLIGAVHGGDPKRSERHLSVILKARRAQ